MTDSNSSNSSRGGECKSPPGPQGSPAKNWTLRWSNYPSNWKDIIVPEFQSHGCLGYCIGEEICPTTGTPHLQGHAEFKNKLRWSVFKTIPKGVEWQARRGNRQSNDEYCSKEGKAIAWGTCKVTKKYTVDITLYEWQIKIVKEILDVEPDDRTIWNVWEPDGCAGKTTFQKWIFLNYQNVVVLSGKASDMKNGIIAYEELKGELPKIVLINIPRCQDTDHISWQGIEEIKDMFFFSPKYQSGMICGPNPHMIIFSNEELPRYKLSDDRWKFMRIEPRGQKRSLE